VAAVFVARADLVARIGADTVAQLFDDDRDGVADDEPLNTILDDANRLTEARLLLKGFTRDQLALLSTDGTLRRFASDIALGLAGRRRPEWIDAEGRGRFDAISREAEKNLTLIAQGELRVPAESVHGGNQNLVGAIRVPDPPFVFTGSRANPRGPGGF
jgi:phage gp36-like protein